MVGHRDPVDYRIRRSEVERYHGAAIELAEAARRIVGPAAERGFAIETKPDASPVTDMVDRLVALFREGE